jgi:hypothetical protein
VVPEALASALAVEGETLPEFDYYYPRLDDSPAAKGLAAPTGRLLSGRPYFLCFELSARGSAEFLTFSSANGVQTHARSRRKIPATLMGWTT